MAVLKYKDNNEWKESTVATAYEVSDIPAPTLSNLKFTEDLSCLNYGGKWDWFLTKYKDYIETYNISKVKDMFANSSMSQIPFKIKLGPGTKTVDFLGFLSGSHIQTLNDTLVIPEDISSYTLSLSNMFSSGSYLREIPSEVLNLETYANKKGIGQYGFTNCFVLDKINNLGVNQTKAQTSNLFTGMLSRCCRLQSFTFVPNQTASWQNQVINFSSPVVGVAPRSYDLSVYMKGDTKLITNESSYNLYKNHPNRLTKLEAYALYNHDSAVETINSLPDTSAYLASTSGGTNTIKFKGTAGSATDGGAINTLTEAEIAVATAKGWTVSLV